MRDALRHLVAEFLGIFAVVFLGGGAILMAQQGAGNLLTVALAHGVVYAALVSATLRVSGHFNPAVTLGFLVTRRIQPMMAALYVVAQLVGAMAAAYALKGTFPEEAFAGARGSTQSIALAVEGGQAFLLEAIATFFLVFTLFGTAVDPQAPKLGGLAVGLVVVADLLAIAPLTGGSLNPARSFGPAVAAGIYEGQLIFWTGPIVGGIVAAVLYDQLFLPRGPEEPGSGAVQPVQGRRARREHAV
ncbi:aquaporin [Roseisolibacter sp. H3M3-2]|uniref:MIP/aquaporin family protein n=1 Tax=Roseisolibacter sp. H3M3-2 TaxID=3031323 RepID=UPI0023DBA899|nr:aquaporin [Roseisolibacter sp. H3M3-2]MDF1502441.1 aquaporin [Roseisolibacter sp. H3M3-2]